MPTTPTTSSSTPDTSTTSSGARLAGRIISGLCGLFLLMDGVMKLFKPAPVVEGTVSLGYRESAIVPIGLVLVACTLLFLIPRTAVLGAILLTGYLGGAVATHVRVGAPLFSHTLFPVYLGVLIWLGLLLRESRLRTLLPLRNMPGDPAIEPTEPVLPREATTSA